MDGKYLEDFEMIKTDLAEVLYKAGNHMDRLESIQKDISDMKRNKIDTEKTSLREALNKINVMNNKIETLDCLLGNLNKDLNSDFSSIVTTVHSIQSIIGYHENEISS